jgi:hypothetical protein
MPCGGTPKVWMKARRRTETILMPDGGAVLHVVYEISKKEFLE